ncbi:ArsR/SmtB family transcription factor [Amycolatopsis aidingensis]|uniref:ArsR/SmtB family transcription factor n=1 Tax=Amycolatopsis aidingensis TaxID=2842453 RepID=UPI001C0CEC84|nr:winged helix-turn-helix domain-containing protein [Amycolatopsis aidingensis]
MVLQMVFEREDLARVRLESAPDPMWELLLGLYRWQAGACPAAYGSWRAEVADLLTTQERARWAVARLCQLLPGANAPDFLTPSVPVTELGTGCELLARTPSRQLRRDLLATFPGGTAPGWLRKLAAGHREDRAELITTVRQGYATLVAPRWSAVRGVVGAEHAARARLLTGQGVGALLGDIPGVLRWDGRVLETRYPEDRTVYLGGRGLRLLPSYFCWGNPVTWLDPELPPALVYQAQQAHPAGRLPDRSDRLVALLGRTRARCLALLTASRTTSELARQAGITVGSASKHAGVLREAGLVSSTRHGPTVLHHATPLGIDLLSGPGQHGTGATGQP